MPRCHKRERILGGWEVEETAENCKQQMTRIYPPNELLGRQSCVGTQAYADTGRHRHTRRPAHRLQRRRHTGLQTSMYRQAGKDRGKGLRPPTSRSFIQNHTEVSFCQK